MVKIDFFCVLLSLYEINIEVHNESIVDAIAAMPMVCSSHSAEQYAAEYITRRS